MMAMMMMTADHIHRTKQTMVWERAREVLGLNGGSDTKACVGLTLALCSIPVNAQAGSMTGSCCLKEGSKT